VSDKQEGLKILSDHPETKDRVVAINAMPAMGAVTPLLDAVGWAALKRICAIEAPAAPAPAAAGPDGQSREKTNPQ
jgi:hypothetical protein